MNHASDAHRFPSIEQRVERFKQYYAKSNERPLLGFFYGDEYPLPRYGVSSQLPTETTLTPDDFVVDYYLAEHDLLHDLHASCGGDFIWSACAYWGIPWMEALLGCPVEARHDAGSIIAHRPEGFDPARPLPTLDESNPWLLKALEFLDKSARHAEGRFPLATTRMRGVADLLAVFLGDDRLPIAMMTEPDTVHRLAEQVTERWIEFARLQLERIPDFHGGLGSFYYYMWAPAGTVWHQEDAAALLSPELYDEFIRPCDEKIVTALDHVIMHTHSTGYIPVDAYCDMGFLAIEHHIDTGGPSVESLFDRHRQFLEAGPLLIWGDIPEADLDWIFSRLPAQGLAVQCVVQSPEEARAIWDRYVGSSKMTS